VGECPHPSWDVFASVFFFCTSNLHILGHGVGFSCCAVIFERAYVVLVSGLPCSLREESNCAYPRHTHHLHNLLGALCSTTWPLISQLLAPIAVFDGTSPHSNAAHEL